MQEATRFTQLTPPFTRKRSSDDRADVRELSDAELDQ